MDSSEPGEIRRHPSDHSVCSLLAAVISLSSDGNLLVAVIGHSSACNYP